MRTQLFDLLPLDQIFFFFPRTVGAAKRPAPTGSAKLLFSYLLLKKSCKYSESSDGRGLDPAHPDGLYSVPIEILPIPCWCFDRLEEHFLASIWVSFCCWWLRNVSSAACSSCWPSAIRPCPGNQSINNICQNKSVFGTVVSAMVKTPARLSDFYPKLPVLIGMLLLNIVQYRYLVVRFTLYSGANILKF